MQPRRTANWTRTLLALALLCIALLRANAATNPVYVVDLHGTVVPAMADFLDAQLADATKQGAAAVILDVDSNGGLLDAADQMQKAIYSHAKDYTIVGFVHNKAFSSASLITLSCNKIAMTPGATLGSALPHPGLGNEPDPELLQAVQNKFKSVAEMHGRNPSIAVAMVTAPAAIPSLGIKAGDILSLTTKEAQANGYCDIVANDYPDILAALSLAGSPVVHRELTPGQEFAMGIVTPWVTIIMLAIGVALIAAEMLTFHTHGLLAIVGGVLIATVFIANIVAGTATVVGLLLFVGGAVLVYLELHVFPGHGFVAGIGLVCIFAGMFLALGGNQNNAALSLSGALLVTVGLLGAFFIYLPRSGVWRRLGNSMQQRASAGYVSSADFTRYVGQSGTAVTLLRPSGIAEVDGERLNVVTNGSFVASGTPVEVIAVMGGRIVVAAIGEAGAEPPADA